MKMKLLVTGGSGFIGSAVIRLAISRGYEIVNVDCLTYAAGQNNLSSVSANPNYVFENANICDRDHLEMLFHHHKPDCVMHLAAESHVDRSISEPDKFIKTNINGTYNLLSVAHKYWRDQKFPDQFRFHHVSTDEVYGSLEIGAQEKFTEKTPYNPRSPYSASKAASDHIVCAWRETYNLPTLITNCSNNYGPCQFPDKLIPLTILNAISKKKIPIYGDGSNIRDWLYVDDHANALLLVLEKSQPGCRYNIGADQEISNLDLVKTICATLENVRPLKNGHYSDLISFVADRPGHDKRYAVDAELIKTQLGWRPAYSLTQGIQETVTWYIENSTRTIST